MDLEKITVEMFKKILKLTQEDKEVHFCFSPHVSGVEINFYTNEESAFFLKTHFLGFDDVFVDPKDGYWYVYIIYYLDFFPNKIDIFSRKMGEMLEFIENGVVVPLKFQDL